jgi:hypothetical protein
VLLANRRSRLAAPCVQSCGACALHAIPCVPTHPLLPPLRTRAREPSRPCPTLARSRPLLPPAQVRRHHSHRGWHQDNHHFCRVSARALRRVKRVRVRSPAERTTSSPRRERVVPVWFLAGAPIRTCISSITSHNSAVSSTPPRPVQGLQGWREDQLARMPQRRHGRLRHQQLPRFVRVH